MCFEKKIALYFAIGLSQIIFIIFIIQKVTIISSILVTYLKEIPQQNRLELCEAVFEDSIAISIKMAYL